MSAELKWSPGYRLDVSEVSDEDLRRTLEWSADLMARLAERCERYEQHIDAAFGHASSGDAHGARVELTEARWGSTRWGSFTSE